jgi:hypothetical protein
MQVERRCSVAMKAMSEDKGATDAAMSAFNNMEFGSTKSPDDAPIWLPQRQVASLATLFEHSGWGLMQHATAH